MDDTFITHQPIFSRQGKVIASRLSIAAGPEAGALAHAVESLRKVEEYWPTGQQAYFLSFGDTPLGPELFDWMVPENATIELSSRDLAQAGRDSLRAAVGDAGAALCLRVDEQIGEALKSGFSFRFLGFDAGTIAAAQMQALAIKLKPFGIPIAIHVDSPALYKSCSEAGMHACAGWFCKTPTTAVGKALAPSQAQIVRLLNLVRANADVGRIETALKQDVTVSYKLLRYINSAGFGLSCEIQSFRHAVTMLGYDKLHKWLSLLLVTASKATLAPAVMHAALVRARLMELIGQGLVDKSELDNLFITGAFSLLDVLLGVGMETALGEMHLPEPITEALVQRSGLYAPFYEIALACEAADASALPALADSLGIAPRQVNAALLQALSFAATLAV